MANFADGIARTRLCLTFAVLPPKFSKAAIIKAPVNLLFGSSCFIVCCEMV